MRSKRRIKVGRVAGVLIATVSAMALASSPAVAETDGHTVVVYSDDPGATKGAKSIFFGRADPEAFQTCDTQSDGYRSYSKFTWAGGHITLEDADGASDFCDDNPRHIERKDLPKGTEVTIETCLLDGPLSDGNKPFDCAYGYGDA